MAFGRAFCVLGLTSCDFLDEVPKFWRKNCLNFQVRNFSKTQGGLREVTGRTFLPTRPPHSAHASAQDILNIYTQIFDLFNFNFNYQHATRCLDCGEYIYKQLHLGRIHISLYYLLCNSAPWRWSSTTETCRWYKLRKYISLCILLVFIGNFSETLICFHQTTKRNSQEEHSCKILDFGCGAFLASFLMECGAAPVGDWWLVPDTSRELKGFVFRSRSWIISLSGSSVNRHSVTQHIRDERDFSLYSHKHCRKSYSLLCFRKTRNEFNFSKNFWAGYIWNSSHNVPKNYVAVSYINEIPSSSTSFTDCWWFLTQSRYHKF